MVKRFVAGLGISVMAAALVAAQGAPAPAQGEQGSGRGRAGGGAGAAGAAGEQGGRAGGGRAGGAPALTQEQWDANPKTQEWQKKALAIAGNDGDLVFDVGIFCKPSRGADNVIDRQKLGAPNSEPRLPAYPATVPPTNIGIQRMFDNFYWAGSTYVGAWIITSDDGYIVYDAMNNAADARDVIVPAMRSAGMDPTKIKYLVFGHSHGDHTGGGRHLQRISGAKAVQHWADWDAYLRPYQAPGGRTGRGGAALTDEDDRTPMTRDIEATDGMELTIGNRDKTTVTIYQMTGHTPGSLAMVVPVKYAGGIHPILIITAGNAFDNINAMIGGYEHIWKIALERKVESVMQAHPNTNMNLLARTKYVHENYGRIPRNPLLYGPERTAKYIEIVRACTRAWMVATGMTSN
jgi:metallo-beta-lactamase class B